MLCGALNPASQHLGKLKWEGAGEKRVSLLPQPQDFRLGTSTSEHMVRSPLKGAELVTPISSLLSPVLAQVAISKRHPGFPRCAACHGRPLGGQHSHPVALHEDRSLLGWALHEHMGRPLELAGSEFARLISLT